MKIYYKILTGALIAIVPVLTQSQNISTFAGTGLSGYFGDGGQATDAELSSPGGLYMDKTGNVLIADQGNGSIRQVSASGIVTTIVGVGAGGYYGDGGQATAAELSAPELLWVDTSSGNLFIADQLNNRIRKVDNSGIITTVAGIGVSGYSGDGGQATDAELATPIAVSFDNSGNMYIADYSTHHIRKVDNSGVITTIAGTGIGGYNGDGIQATAAELNNPSSVRVDAAGNIYVSEINGQRIRKIDPSGIISTIAGTGAGGYNGDGISATSAQISDPFDVFLDASGDVFIAEFIGNRVREVNTSGMISTIAGIGVGGFSGDGGLATAAELNYPLAIYVDASANMYIAEWGNNRVRYVGGIPTGTNRGVSGSAQVSVYPNPANDLLTIYSSKNIDGIRVYNLTGELLDNYDYGNKAMISKQIDVSKYPAGVYFLKVRSNGEEIIRKAVISR